VEYSADIRLIQTKIGLNTASDYIIYFDYYLFYLHFKQEIQIFATENTKVCMKPDLAM